MSCVTKVPTEKTSPVKCETPLQPNLIFQGKKKENRLFSASGKHSEMVKNKWSERERMDGLLLDKYCETWWRDGAVFIADININFPGVALLAQRGLNTGKLERKFSEPQGRGIKEPWLRDL